MTPVDEMREMAVVFDAEDYPDLARRLCSISHDYERMERELARLKKDPQIEWECETEAGFRFGKLNWPVPRRGNF